MATKPKTKSRGASMERTAWRGFARRLIESIQKNPEIDPQVVADRIMEYSQGRQQRVMARPGGLGKRKASAGLE